MADFVDAEAEESDRTSEDEGLSDGELRPVRKVERKKKRTIQISDDEEEDEEEGM